MSYNALIKILFRNRFKSLKELQHHQDQDHNQESGYETLEAEGNGF